jgi:zinc transport system substrate-binding protein
MTRTQKYFAAVIIIDLIVAIVIITVVIRHFFQPEPDDGRLQVMVSIDPQAYFVERIGGDRVAVEVLVPPGREPETYTPTPDKIRQLVSSRVFFRTGFPMETALLPKLNGIAPKLQVVDTRANLDLRHTDPYQHEADDRGHIHVSGCDCGMDGIDPHIWVSPALVKRQAETIRNSLIALDPDGKAEYDANCERFVADLTELQSEIREKLAPFLGKTIYVYHPTYGYFCDEFGLVQKAIEVDGKAPTPRSLADWISRARKDEVRVIFVQPEFNRSAAEQAAKLTGAKVVTHSTLRRDYFLSMQELATLIYEVYTHPITQED